MKSRIFIFIAACLMIISCSQKPEAPEFWLGADLGWITEMEHNGHKFYNKDGQERECTALMKELGLNAVRHRVWVDPSKHGNWCSKEDLLVKCQRALFTCLCHSLFNFKERAVNILSRNIKHMVIPGIVLTSELYGF